MSDSLNLILGNQRTTYNKADLNYEQKNNVNNFSSICHAIRISKCSIPKCNYCGKNDHVALLRFIRKKIMKGKNVSSSSYFYKKNSENKMKNIPSLSFLHDRNSSWKSRDNRHYTNITKSKVIWVPKVNT